MRLTYHVMSSPVGLLFIVGGEDGLKSIRFMDRKSIKRMIADHAATFPDAEWGPSLLENKPVVDQLEAYFCGALSSFDVKLAPRGTPFQLDVWRALLDVPFGQTRSYGQIAKAIGQPKSARAVGLANNQNPIPIIVPCHRVVGSKGALTGYGGGVQRKRWLLQHETRFAGVAGSGDDLLSTAAADRSGGKRSR
jgi:methylated-DNA-[protein]-cysteine S-methyltransferase